MEILLIPTQASTQLPGERILVLAPHPDDEVFGCGGAILAHVERGQRVHVVIATDGAYGADDAAACAEQRRAESVAAAAILGYGTPEFWSLPDRELVYSEHLVQRIMAAAGAHKADLVYCPCVLEMHPDHRALALAAVEAVRRLGAEVRLAQYEIGVPLRPNVLLDISATVARKQAAMECFVSQLAKQRYDLDITALNRYRTYTLPATVTAAEAYMLATGAELAEDPMRLFESEHARQRQLGLPLDSRDLPLVSVLIRSMDRSTLSRALDSIALQTWPNIEVVVVNAIGADHDELPAWCGRFPLHSIKPGKALGRSAAANAALAAATGAFMLFLDDDDWLLPHHIARAVQEFDNNDNTIVVYAAIDCVDDNGKHLLTFAQPFDPVRLRIENFIPIHAAVFRREVLAKGARFDEGLQVCEDWDFWLQLLEMGPFRFIPETGGVYLRHDNNNSSVWDKPELAREAMLRIYRKRLPGWDDTSLWQLLEFSRQGCHYNDLVQTVDELEATAAERDSRIATLDRQIADLTTVAEKRQVQVESMLASTSWRITQPLRTLVTRLRKQPGNSVHAASGTVAPAQIQSQSQSQQHVYDYAIDPGSHSAPAFVLQLVGNGRRVLEVGCGPGSITRMLAQQNQCRVTGIELDPSAIELARPWCENIVQGDLNQKDWPSLLGDMPPFDTVLAADVLEHLYDPWATLNRMAALIGPDGFLVISLPHAGHAAVAACLLDGDFEYRDWGLLDRTHIRFFGLKNIEALFQQAGLKIIDKRFVVKPVETTEFAANWARLPAKVQRALKSSSHADIYQVVVKAVPLHYPGTAMTLQPA